MNIPTILLNDGHSMPQLGFGLWQVPNAEATTATVEAFRAGYRSIDSAAVYQNEHGLAEAIRQSDLPRQDLYITTKLWNADQGYESTLKAFETSLKNLGLEKLDLYLIHWPAAHKDLYAESWRALVKLQKDGRVKSIGVSNFTAKNLDRIIKETGVTPAINQIELHPRFQQTELRRFHEKHGIVTESWSPLGQGQILNEPSLLRIAGKHKATAAQVIIRWHIQNALVVIPKSVTPSRIRENIKVFGFDLDSSDMEAIRQLDSKEGRIGPDPETATF